MKEIFATQDTDTDDVKVETIEDTDKGAVGEEAAEKETADAKSVIEETADDAVEEEAADATSANEAKTDADLEVAEVAAEEDSEVAEVAVDENSEVDEGSEVDEAADEADEAVTDDAKEAGDDSKEDGPLDRVWRAIRMYRRDEVSVLIRDHAIDIATDEQKMEIGKGIMGLRDIKLVEQFAKEQKVFTPDMLRLDFENWNNRDFVRQVLSQCKKNFDLSDEQVCRELFEISCEVGQTEVLSFLVNKKKATDCYPMLASGTEEAFAVLKQVKPASLDADMRVEIMLAAATTTQGQERLEKLSSFGYNLFEENSDEKELSDLLNERIASNTYTKNRAGDMKRMKDKSVVQYIERKRNPVDPKAGRKKFSIKKALPFLILGLIFLCVLVYAIAYQIFS